MLPAENQSLGWAWSLAAFGAIRGEISNVTSVRDDAVSFDIRSTASGIAIETKDTAEVYGFDLESLKPTGDRFGPSLAEISGSG